ncbi:MAG: alpha/beta hydrolase, partial [Patescibacteria group bacterium]|nr:alpha/beta hydrolase [Patescibacteria group bacterium]
SGGNRHIPSEFLDQKFLVVPVNYRLFPRAKCAEAIEDAAAAVAWTMKNIEPFGGDPKKVTVSGHSAGGYLTAMVGMAPGYLAKHGLKNTDLAALYPISGQMTTHFQVVAERETGEKGVANNPLVIDQFAPLFHTASPVSPIHLLVGDAALEWPARVEENALLAAMLRRAKENKVEYHSYPGTNHGSCGPPSRAYIQAELNNMAESQPAE